MLVEPTSVRLPRSYGSTEPGLFAVGRSPTPQPLRSYRRMAVSPIFLLQGAAYICSISERIQRWLNTGPSVTPVADTKADSRASA